MVDPYPDHLVLADNKPHWIRQPLLIAVILGVTLLVWEGLVQADQSSFRLIPAPSEIWVAVQRNASTLITQHIPVTMQETLLGLGIALLFGMIVAMLMDFSPLLRQILYPLLVISQTIPLIALAALLIILFGFEMGPKVVVVILFCFFPITIATISGLTATDPDIVALLRTMGASRWQIWRKVRLPAALPSFFSGLRIATAYSVTGAVTGEYITAKAGLGQFLRSSYNSGRVDQAFAAIAIITLLSLGLVVIVNLVERIAMPWFFTQARTHWDEPGIY